MSRVLVIAEHAGGKLSPSTAKTVSCAGTIPDAETDVAVFAADGGAVAAEAAKLHNVSRVLQVDNPANTEPLAAVLAPQVVALAGDYSHVLAPSTTFGKDLLPRVAALLGVGQLSDVMAVESAWRFRRPIYAGNAIVTVEAPQDRTLVATVRVASFQAVADDGSASIEATPVDVALPGHTRFVEHSTASGDRPDLQAANRVVSGGRALGSAENFSLIQSLADRLGAAVGATRAAVDAGYVASDLQIGQTGKIIAPELYVAVGISGAIQHLTGIKDAGIIVAINKDPDAPIFELADIGLVGDLFTLLPDLERSLQEASAA